VKTKLQSILFALCGSIGAALLLTTGTTAALVADEATIDKSSVVVTTQRHTVYFGNGKGAGDFTTWSWTPRIEFRVNGPIASGSQLQVEYTLPGNKSWLKFDCKTGEARAGGWWQLGTPGCGANLPDEQGSLATGQVDFKILLKNELQGTNTTLFTGKLNVKKFHVGNDQPQFKNNFDYYVDLDWNLPIGYVYHPEPRHTASGGTDFVNWAPLDVSMWFRGEVQEGEVNAYLFYNGKAISSTDTTAQGSVGREELASTFDESIYKWSRMKFRFFNALVFNKTPAQNPNAFRLDKNPGEYEVKVLRHGHLARDAKFTVGADGKIVDNGVGRNNNLGSSRMVLPVQILGNEDGQWDKTAWKTGAFYGNPLTGFNAP
jgi:hypothetical protein